jgi:hypothetical protein
MTCGYIAQWARAACATSWIVGPAFCLVTGAAVLAEQPGSPSMPVQADAQIASLLDKLENALAETATISDNEVDMLVSARLLSAHASTRGQHLLRKFPVRLNEHADRESNVLKSVKLRVFADTATALLVGDVAEPAQVPAAATPDPSKAPTPDPLSLAAMERTGLDQVRRPKNAPAPPPPTPPAAQPHAQSSMERSLLDRGDAVLALGDVSAARLLYARAAETAGIAALRLAETYEPAFLAAHDLRGIKPDAAQAEKWYRKAAEMGERQAIDRLNNLRGHSTAKLLGTR